MLGESECGERELAWLGVVGRFEGFWEEGWEWTLSSSQLIIFCGFWGDSGDFLFEKG